MEWRQELWENRGAGGGPEVLAAPAGNTAAGAGAGSSSASVAARRPRVKTGLAIAPSMLRSAADSSLSPHGNFTSHGGGGLPLQSKPAGGARHKQPAREGKAGTGAGQKGSTSPRRMLPPAETGVRVAALRMAAEREQRRRADFVAGGAQATALGLVEGSQVPSKQATFSAGLAMPDPALDAAAVELPPVDALAPAPFAITVNTSAAPMAFVDMRAAAGAQQAGKVPRGQLPPLRQPPALAAEESARSLHSPEREPQAVRAAEPLPPMVWTERRAARAPAGRREADSLRAWVLSAAPAAAAEALGRVDTTATPALELAGRQALAVHAVLGRAVLELARQDAVHCAERGRLLAELWGALNAALGPVFAEILPVVSGECSLNFTRRAAAGATANGAAESGKDASGGKASKPNKAAVTFADLPGIGGEAHHITNPDVLPGLSGGGGGAGAAAAAGENGTGNGVGVVGATLLGETLGGFGGAAEYYARTLHTGDDAESNLLSPRRGRGLVGARRRGTSMVSATDAEARAAAEASTAALEAWLPSWREFDDALRPYASGLKPPRAPMASADQTVGEAEAAAAEAAPLDALVADVARLVSALGLAERRRELVPDEGAGRAAAARRKQLTAGGGAAAVAAAAAGGAVASTGPSGAHSHGVSGASAAAQHGHGEMVAGEGGEGSGSGVPGALGTECSAAQIRPGGSAATIAALEVERSAERARNQRALDALAARFDEAADDYQDVIALQESRLAEADERAEALTADLITAQRDTAMLEEQLGQAKSALRAVRRKNMALVARASAIVAKDEEDEDEEAADEGEEDATSPATGVKAERRSVDSFRSVESSGNLAFAMSAGGESCVPEPFVALLCTAEARAMAARARFPRDTPTLQRGALSQLLTTIYCAKAHDDEEANSRGKLPAPLHEFLYDFFMRRAGNAGLAERMLLTLVASVRRHLSASAKISTFARALGVFRPLPPEALVWCLMGLLAVLAAPLTPTDVRLGEERELLPLSERADFWFSLERAALGIKAAVAQPRAEEGAGGEGAGTAAGTDDTQAESLQEWLQDSLRASCVPDRGGGVKVSLESVMEALVGAWERQRATARASSEKLFAAADSNGDGCLDFDEFLTFVQRDLGIKNVRDALFLFRRSMLQSGSEVMTATAFADVIAQHREGKQQALMRSAARAARATNAVMAAHRAGIFVEGGNGAADEAGPMLGEGELSTLLDAWQTMAPQVRAELGAAGEEALADAAQLDSALSAIESGGGGIACTASTATALWATFRRVIAAIEDARDGDDSASQTDDEERTTEEGM